MRHRDTSLVPASATCNDAAMGARNRNFVLALTMLAALLPTASARADAVDGDWCFSDGRRMSINGPEIVTPARTRAQGDYDRHAFSYIVPKNDPGAGTVVSMVVIDDDTLYVNQGAKQSLPAAKPQEVWHRCGQPIS